MARVCPRTVRMLGNHVGRLPMARVCPRTVRLLASQTRNTRDSCTSRRFPNVAGITKPSQ
eukprot:2967874-Prymnesium_polylepis.1